MRAAILVLSIAVLCATTVLADTIYLKDGRRIEGEVLRYENDQFVVQVANTRVRSGFQLLYFRSREVDRVVIAGRNERAAPANQLEEREVEVGLSDDWVDTRIDLKPGQRVQVTATGTVYLNGRTASGPNGISRRDPRAPAPDASEGMLVGAVGDDPGARVFQLGQSGELVADRAGRLYLTVNKYDYQGARGTYRVRLLIDRAGADRPAPSAPTGGNERTFTIRGTDSWVDTNLRVQRGQNLRFEANGEVRVSRNRVADPDGAVGGLGSVFNEYPVTEAGTGALIGKIVHDDGSESKPFLIGKSKDFAVTQGGRLYLGINDDEFSDNDGRFSVRVRY